jgi:hypothetical protein
LGCLRLRSVTFGAAGRWDRRCMRQGAFLTSRIAAAASAIHPNLTGGCSVQFWPVHHIFNHLQTLQSSFRFESLQFRPLTTVKSPNQKGPEGIRAFQGESAKSEAKFTGSAGAKLTQLKRISDGKSVQSSRSPRPSGWVPNMVGKHTPPLRVLRTCPFVQKESRRFSCPATSQLAVIRLG